MRQLTIDEAGRNINGSHLVGYVRATYPELCQVFGAPISQPWDEDKSSVEWYLELEDGCIATLYDYYSSAIGNKPYDWHIGGKTLTVADSVKAAIEANKTLG